MATVALKRLGRGKELLSWFRQAEWSLATSNAQIPLTESRCRFSAIALHRDRSQPGHTASFALRISHAIRNLHEQVVGSSDAHEHHLVYENADEQAASLALQSFLQKHSQAYLSDAAEVVAHAPLYVKQLVCLVKKERQEHTDSEKDKVDSKASEDTMVAMVVNDGMDAKAGKKKKAAKATVESKSRKKKTAEKTKLPPVSQGGSELSFEKQVLSYLSAENINVLEPILESVGVCSDRLQPLQQKLTEENVDVQSFLFVIRWIERLGFSRTCVGDIVEKEIGVISLRGEEVEAVFSILKELSIPEDDIRRLIKNYPLILKAVVADNIAVLRSELSELPSSDCIVRIAVCRSPAWVQGYEKGQAEGVLQFLRSYGLTEERLDQALQRHHRVIFLNMENLKNKVNFLKNLGLSRVLVGKVLWRSPAFLLRSLENNLTPRLQFFNSMGISDAEFASMIKRYPGIFCASLEKKIKPAVEELRTLGLSEEGLKKVVIYRPSLFAYKLGGDISALVSGLKETGYSDHQKVTAFIKLYTRGIGHRKSCEDCLMRYGLSALEAKQVLDKDPGILGYNEKALTLKLDHLTRTLGVPAQNLLSAPSYLSSGFKSCFLRRERVLAYMKSKGLLTSDVTLKHVLSPSNGQFYKKFVKPYAEDRELSMIWHKERKGVGREDGMGFILNYPVKVLEPPVDA